MIDWEHNLFTALAEHKTNREVATKMIELGDKTMINSPDPNQLVRYRTRLLRERLAYYRDWVEDADKMIADSPQLQEKMW